MLRFRSDAPLAVFNFHFIISTFRLLPVPICRVFCCCFFTTDFCSDRTDAAINCIIFIRTEETIAGLAAMAEITKAFLKDTEICLLYQAAIKEWQGQMLPPFVPLRHVQNVLAAFGSFNRERERENKTIHLWASGSMGYCKDMIIIVCLPAFPPPLNILFSGAQQTPGDVLEMKRS